jgi:hypothetical protein
MISVATGDPSPGERAVQRLPGSESGVEVDDTRDGRMAVGSVMGS